MWEQGQGTFREEQRTVYVGTENSIFWDREQYMLGQRTVYVGTENSICWDREERVYTHITVNI